MEQTTRYQIGQLTTAPLGVLIPAKEGNARKQKRTQARIRRMAVSIHMHGGLLQNLVVVAEEQDGQQTGRLEVVAGETRRLGLCALRDGWLDDAKGYSDEFPVPVLVRTREEATAASTTENIEREDMHPADQFIAFQKMVADCGSIEEVAAMYRVTPLVVKRRLRLANAHPKLLQLYRQDGMTLDQLMALCINDDHPAQWRVWEASKGRDWERTPDRLRRAMTVGDMELDAPLVRFVGIDVYEAAGGAVRRDLFSDRDSGFITDAALLQRLAVERLEKTAAKVRSEGWGWVETRIELQHHDLTEFGRAEKVRRPLTDIEQGAWDRLDEEVTELCRTLDALYDSSDECRAVDGAEAPNVQRKLCEARAKRRRLEEKCLIWTPQVVALAGAIVAVDHHGAVAVHRGLVRSIDRKAASKAMAVHMVPSDAAASRDEQATMPGASLAGAISCRLIGRLTAHRTIGLQRVLADNTHVALAALAHTLIQQMLDGRRANSALRVDARVCADELSRYSEQTIEECRAWKELTEIRDAWGDRLPGDHAKLLPWLICLPMTELCGLLALCSALSVNAVATRPGNHAADDLAAAVNLDMADWWEPTADNYMMHVPKALIVDAVREAVSEQAAASLANLKKDQVIARAKAQMVGKRRVPGVLRPNRDPAPAPVVTLKEVALAIG